MVPVASRESWPQVEHALGSPERRPCGQSDRREPRRRSVPVRAPRVHAPLVDRRADSLDAGVLDERAELAGGPREFDLRVGHLATQGTRARRRSGEEPQHCPFDVRVDQALGDDRRRLATPECVDGLAAVPRPGLVVVVGHQALAADAADEAREQRPLAVLRARRPRVRYLRLVEQGTVDDRLMGCWVRGEAGDGELAEVDPVADDRRGSRRADAEDAPDGTPRLPGRPRLERPHDQGGVLVGLELPVALLALAVAERHAQHRPHAALDGGHLRPFDVLLVAVVLELGERGERVALQPTRPGRGVDVLGDRHDLPARRLDALEELQRVRQPAAEPRQVGDDDPGVPALLDTFDRLLQDGSVQLPARLVKLGGEHVDLDTAALGPEHDLLGLLIGGQQAFAAVPDPADSPVAGPWECHGVTVHSMTGRSAVTGLPPSPIGRGEMEPGSSLDWEMWGDCPRQLERVEVVYFILAAEARRIKIGKTSAKELRRRLSALRGANGATLEVLRIVNCWPYTEEILHEAFAAWRHHGEWFEACPRLLKLVHSADDERVRRFHHAYRELLEDSFRTPCPRLGLPGGG